MYTSIVILVVLAAVLMCLIVLIQESKGGGLAADYSSNNQILGAPKTTNFVEKATWTLAGTIIALSILSVAFLPTTGAADSVILKQATEQKAVNPNNMPGMTQPSAADQKQAPAAEQEKTPAEDAQKEVPAKK